MARFIEELTEKIRARNIAKGLAKGREIGRAKGRTNGTHGTGGACELRARGESFNEPHPAVERLRRTPAPKRTRDT